MFGRETLPAVAGLAFAALAGRLTVVQGDVRDQVALNSLFQTHRIDRMLSFAGITAGPRREAEDTETRSNVTLRSRAGPNKLALPMDQFRG